MKKRLVLCSCLALAFVFCEAQLIFYKDKIQSPYTLKDDKAVKRRQRLIDQANSLDTLKYPEQEEDIKAALWAVSQFLVKTPQSDAGISKLAANITTLDNSTQRALLEVLFGLYPAGYESTMRQVMSTTSSQRNYAMACVWLYRQDVNTGSKLAQSMKQKFPGWQSDALLVALNDYLLNNQAAEPPSLDSLFAHQGLHGFKVVYSFQRRNRDYPGLAVVQNADGKFARDSMGNLRHFVQLARAASNLPWFLTNGNTPQGLYAITGTGISRNVFIGPTPNLQMVMLGEVNPPTFTHYFPIVFNAPPEKIYRSYYPQNWQQWPGLMQAYDAGKIGRSEIIAHGSTIDPEWFSQQPYYPLSPTLGCLSGREIWNSKTGKIDNSDQLDLVNTFIETKGTKGYLIVIELGDKQGPVTAAEIEQFIAHFETAVLPFRKPATVETGTTQGK